MKLVLIPYILFIAGWSFQQDSWVAPEEARKLKNPIAADDHKSIAKGKKLYEKVCWTCHGMSGEGDGPAGVSLSPKPASFKVSAVQQQTDGELMWKITHGNGNMPVYEDLLSERQRWQLVSYIRTLNN